MSHFLSSFLLLLSSPFLFSCLLRIGFGAFQQNMDSSCEDPRREGAPRGSCPPSSIPGHLTVFSFVCARDHFLTTLMGCYFANLNKDSLLNCNLHQDMRDARHQRLVGLS
ncbi:unnamed protein product [Musa acuminata subsp. malaccensis]|uniref:(wild Malaysian banana) hypothetical protein n=1 Tax=Musa acuminata subsp. malaccensis TaxID=214687 RepID=A0A804IUD0_MUSAM|nr:unnamed protein product [Musa acuminata subsp. malaccensis]